jgi:hypothetical protein
MGKVRSVNPSSDSRPGKMLAEIACSFWTSSLSVRILCVASIEFPAAENWSELTVFLRFGLWPKM